MQVSLLPLTLTPDPKEWMISFWPLQGHVTRPPGLHQVRVMDERWGLLEG